MSDNDEKTSTKKPSSKKAETVEKTVPKAAAKSRKFLVYSTAKGLVMVPFKDGDLIVSPSQKIEKREEDLPETLPAGIKKIEIH